MTPKWIDLVESAYDLETPNHDAWLETLLDASTPLLRPVHAAVGCIFHFENDTLQAFAPKCHDPVYIGRVAAIGADNPDFFKRCYRGKPFESMSGHLGRRAFRGWEAFDRNFGAIGERDAIGVIARDGGPWGVCLSAGTAHRREVTRAQAAPWERIAAHVHAALRLRFRLHGAPQLGESKGRVELRTFIDAVVSPSGKVEHAEPAAQPFAESLKHAALAIDRARARQRREDPEGALEAWRALVEGEWSLVETFESDGRRYLLARRNPPDAARAPLLTDRERRVIGLRARSHGVKLIAYEMGLSPASVSRALGSGVRKLGLASVADLVRRAEGD
jgi:DNA-binding CsgD family transcriptional regulator